MILIFLLGTVFGALLLFMARIVDIKLEPVIQRYKETGRVIESKPIIISPPDEDTQAKMARFVDDLNGV